MALNKVQYTDGETVIYANNLNEIQDEILSHASEITEVGENISDLDSDLSELEGTVSLQGSSITNLQTLTSEHTSMIGTLQSTVLSQGSSISSLQTGKVDKDGDKVLSTNDFTNADKAALDNIKTTDTTLAVSGKAADAKKTGDEISAIKGDIAPTFDATVAYAAGSYVIYNSTLYRFTAAHAAGAWSGTDATAVKLGPELSDVKSDFETQKSKFDEVVEKGYYVQPGQIFYIEATYGMIVSNGTIDYPGNNTGYAWLSAEQKQHNISFDDTVSKANVCYMNNGNVVRYTSWVTESPIILATDIEYDTVGINVRKLSGDYTATDLETVLSYTTETSNVGNLATIDMIPIIGKGLKQIYPDGFSSRIKPDIYLNGIFNADINLNDYKITGSSVVWIATNGNDSTGDGTEENPYLTLTKALTTDAVTIKIKEGTYTQGTHYTTSAVISEKNIIGIGNVIFQNDDSGHYITTSGNVYIENIIFRQGTTPANDSISAVSNDDNQCACFYKCVFNNGKNGIGVIGVDAVLYECIAFGNVLDGFNYHAGTTRIPNVIEINCVAYNNGSAESGSNSCNGSTAHDGVKIIRLNGEYYSCYGGVIADASTSEDETTKSVNFGCIAHTSTGTSQYNASFWATYNTEMYLYDCKCYGSDYDISAFYDAVIVSRRLTTGRNVPSIYANASATVLQY